jgi:non-lysosomal glucosylceramidase
MKEKTGVNRRQFLASTSAAAMGVAALQGKGLSAEVAPRTFRSAAGSSIPYSRQELAVEPGPQSSYTSEQAGEVAFPLGGIGTGTVSIGGRGELRDWEIFNRPAKRRILPFSFVALWVRPEGGSGAMRVVEGPLQPPFRGSNGFNRESGQGLPHFQKTRFTGTYPIAKVDFEDSALPVAVSLEAFNPFIPLNVDDSSLPVAVFKYRVANRSTKPVDVSLAFSLLNPVGYDGETFLKGIDHPGFGKNLATIRQEKVGDTKVAGLDLISEKYAGGDPRYGSMALLTTNSSYTARSSWDSGAWWDSYQKWVDEFSADGKLHDSTPPKPSADGKSEYSTLAPHARLVPGDATTITFILAWYFPVRENYWHGDSDDESYWIPKNEQIKGKRLTNYYGARFKSAWEVASHTAGRLSELESKTRLFTETFFSSSLPPYVLEAVSSQASILRTNTCILLEGKQFFGFEGCGDDEHNGWMNCSHVWNYEQALAFLFPELERSMRNTDFLYEMRSDDSMAFRSVVPLGIAQWGFRPAADGQMGCIMKLYREWQISGDDAFLKEMWPNAKRALEFAWKFWDTDKDGVMEGEQHNTYDIEFFGANPMMTTLYLGALRAGELMASAVGDTAAAASYREVREKGAQNIEELWNGHFYIQKVTPVGEIRPMPPYDKEDWQERVVRDGQLKYQFGEGCLSDQMLGQWFADVLGLDIGLKKERVLRTLKSIYGHNFKDDFWTHSNTQRIYALNDEKGLVLCSWPNGGRPALPFVYADEVWTGIEYQVAAHLIYRGMIEEGLSIVRAISHRYDGVRRNPWNQIEWGNHYSRAMASFSVLLALSGFRYSAVERKVSFQPCIHPEDFRCFFAAGSAWGLYSQNTKAGVLTAKLECRHGELKLRRLVLGGGATKTTFAKAKLTGPDGKQIRCSVKSLAGGHEIELSEELTMREGESATATLTR